MLCDTDMRQTYKLHNNIFLVLSLAKVIMLHINVERKLDQSDMYSMHIINSLILFRLEENGKLKVVFIYMRESSTYTLLCCAAKFKPLPGLYNCINVGVLSIGFLSLFNLFWRKQYLCYDHSEGFVFTYVRATPLLLLLKLFLKK